MNMVTRYWRDLKKMKPEKIDISKEMQMLHDRMAARGLKSTPQRDELAAWIFKVHEHFTVDDVISSFRQMGKKVSAATVYRLVQMMLELGLLIEHDFGKGHKFYEHTPGHPHHDHIICNNCGKIIEFADESLEQLKLKIAQSYGFIMESHSLHIFGKCSECTDKGRT